MSRDRALYFRGDEREGAAVALAATGLPLVSGGLIHVAAKSTPESLVKVLYDSLAEKQRKEK